MGYCSPQSKYFISKRTKLDRLYKYQKQILFSGFLNKMNTCTYSDLKQQVLMSASASDRQILPTLKEFYKHDINSNRRLEQITTVRQLLNILEIRDIISENDVGPLKEICQRLSNNSDLLEKIAQYEVIHVKKEHDTLTTPKTKSGLLSLRMFAEAMKVTALYDKYNVTKYLMGAGLSVTPEYRGLGISVEILKCRIMLTKELALPATGGIFTSAAGQRVAEKAGYECLYQIPYKQFGKTCNIQFDSSTDYLKILGKKME